jgi:hypothetical protein
MSTGPFLYDEGPAPLHTGTPNRRPWLLMAIFGGTIVAGLVMVLLIPLVKGSSEDQVRQVAGVFVAALGKNDVETAHGLLCKDEQARVPPAGLAAAYGASGSGSVEGAKKIQVHGVDQYRVQVRWSRGGNNELTVVNEDGPAVCGVTPLP